MGTKRKQRNRRRRDAEITAKYGKAGHKACGRKVRFPDEQSAMSRAECGMLGTTKRLRVYHCPFCGGWHITSH